VIFKRTENKQDDDCATRRRTNGEGVGGGNRESRNPLRGQGGGLILGGGRLPWALPTVAYGWADRWDSAQ
jgi:hypothetical protein